MYISYIVYSLILMSVMKRYDYNYYCDEFVHWLFIIAMGWGGLLRERQHFQGPRECIPFASQRPVIFMGPNGNVNFRQICNICYYFS